MRSQPHNRRPDGGLPPAAGPSPDGGLASDGTLASPGFTLTEVLVAMAIVSLLLVGISRIFALTSATIGAGQSLSKAVRAQRAVQTSLSNDLLGYGDLANPQLQSGMLPLVNTLDPGYAMPYLAISNFRVPAYASERDFVKDAGKPPHMTPGYGPGLYATYSAAVRGADLDNDGSETGAGELTPLYAYGDRNFRCDTLNFFARGNFESKTNPDPSKPTASSNEAWIWYGQGSVYSGADRLRYLAAGFPQPGDPASSNPTLTPPLDDPSVTSGLGHLESANTNNLYAEQFKLCRFVGLMIEPSDVKMNTQSVANLTKVGAYGVLTNNDPSLPVPFVSRNWLVPSDKTSYSGSAYSTNASLVPLTFATSVVRTWVPTSATVGSLVKVAANGVTETATNISAGKVPLKPSPPNPANTPYDAIAAMTATDIFGVGLRQYRGLLDYLSANKYNNASNWRANAPINWSDRPWVEPSPKLDRALPQVTSTVMARQQQVVADGCSQFTVEYAGDFVTQNLTSGVVTGAQGDGILDFYVVSVGTNRIRETRFYGLPRDVDGDGHVYNTAAAIAASPDVVPLSDLRGGASAFEYSIPPAPTSGNDYMTNVAEPSSNSPNASSYRCVWGPAEFSPENPPPPAVVGGQNVIVRDVPQLLRVIVEVRDPGNKLNQPVRQQYVFPVRVTGAVRDEKIK